MMEPLVDTVIEDARWEAFGLDRVAALSCTAVIAYFDLPNQGFALCVMGCDNAHIATLNADFRGKPAPTNVLSWPSQERGADVAGGVPDVPVPGPADDPEHLGDIAIAWETCEAEAIAAGKSMQDHVTHLVVHGMLHLLGYDHEDDIDATLMETTETRILEILGLSDPYS
jgi:probable rRNA maturation factor